MSHAPKMIPARGVAPARAASHSSKTVASAVSRSMSSLCPTAILNIAGAYSRARRAAGGGSDRVEPVAVPVRREAADRRHGLVAQGNQPAVRGRPGEQLAFDLDRVEREVVEGGDPARVRAPRAHAEVAEERKGSVGAADDDCLV